MTTYRISTDDKLIYLQIQGNVSATEIVSLLRKVSIDENYNRTFNSILDLRKVENMLSAREAQGIIESASSIRGHARAKSAVITDGVFKKNLVDMASALKKTQTLEVKGFTNLEDACSWLNVKENVLN